MNHMKKYKFIILYIINGFLKTFKSHTVRRQSFQMSGPIVERPPRNLGTNILSQNQTPLLSFDVMEFFNQNQLYHTTIPNMRFQL